MYLNQISCLQLSKQDMFYYFYISLVILCMITVRPVIFDIYEITVVSFRCMVCDSDERFLET